MKTDAQLKTDVTRELGDVEIRKLDVERILQAARWIDSDARKNRARAAASVRAVPRLR